MKKMLSILAALGLTATASATAVSCADNDNQVNSNDSEDYAQAITATDYKMNGITFFVRKERGINKEDIDKNGHWSLQQNGTVKFNVSVDGIAAEISDIKVSALQGVNHYGMVSYYDGYGYDWEWRFDVTFKDPMITNNLVNDSPKAKISIKGANWDFSQESDIDGCKKPAIYIWDAADYNSGNKNVTISFKNDYVVNSPDIAEENNKDSKEYLSILKDEMSKVSMKITNSSSEYSNVSDININPDNLTISFKLENPGMYFTSDQYNKLEIYQNGIKIYENTFDHGDAPEPPAPPYVPDREIDTNNGVSITNSNNFGFSEITFKTTNLDCIDDSEVDSYGNWKSLSNGKVSMTLSMIRDGYNLIGGETLKTTLIKEYDDWKFVVDFIYVPVLPKELESLENVIVNINGSGWDVNDTMDLNFSPVQLQPTETPEGDNYYRTGVVVWTYNHRQTHVEISLDESTKDFDHTYHTLESDFLDGAAKIYISDPDSPDNYVAGEASFELDTNGDDAIKYTLESGDAYPLTTGAKIQIYDRGYLVMDYSGNWENPVIPD